MMNLRKRPMSKTETGELSLRLYATSGPMSQGENAENARVLRDDELDAVSGGAADGQDGDDTPTVVKRAANRSILTVEIGIAP
jgi:hypothetical protein